MTRKRIDLLFVLLISICMMPSYARGENKFIPLHDAANDVSLDLGVGDPQIQKILNNNIGASGTTITFDDISPLLLGPGQFDYRFVDQGLVLEGISGNTQVGGSGDSGPINGGGMDVSPGWVSSRVRVYFVKPGTTKPTTMTRMGGFTTTPDINSNCMEFFDVSGQSIGTTCAVTSPWYPVTNIEFLGGVVCGGISYVDIFSVDTPFEVDLLSFSDFAGECKPSACTPRSAGLVAWWPGNGDVSELIAGNNAVSRNGAGFGVGLNKMAFQFDGIDDYFSAPDSPALAFGTTDFTVQLWVNFNTTTGEEIMIEKYVEGSPRTGWTFTKLDGNSLRLHLADTPDSSWNTLDVTPLSIPLNTWIMATVTRSGNTFTIYWNGAAIGSTTFPYPINLTTPASLKFGHRGDPSDTPGSWDLRGFYLNGKINEVAIWSRALSDAEIGYLYNLGLGNPVTGLCEHKGRHRHEKHHGDHDEHKRDHDSERDDEHCDD